MHGVPLPLALQALQYTAVHTPQHNGVHTHGPKHTKSPETAIGSYNV